MPRGKRSFFEKLTGSINTAEDDVFFDDETGVRGAQTQDEDREDAELTVDVYQTPNDIVVETIVAGVDPSELEVEITREMVTISGRRERHEETSAGDFFHRELYWGGFSRTILLPEEIEVEEAEATQKHGLLTIRLPKIDKKKKTRLQIKSN